MNFRLIWMVLTVSLSVSSSSCYGLLPSNVGRPSPQGNSFSQASPHSSTGQRTKSLLSLQNKRYDKGDDRWDEKPSGKLPPLQNRRRRDKNQDYVPVVEDENGLVPLLESSVNFLTTPVAVFGYDLPIVYLVMGIFSFNFVPPTTWALSTVFFGIYLWLGTAVVIGPDNQYNLGDEYKIEEEDDDDITSGIFPIVAFVGAISSAALLSPQGLVMESTSWFSEFTSTVSLAAISIAFGWAFLAEVRGLNKVDERLEVNERQKRVVRDERRRMDEWDEDLDEMSS